MIENNDSYKLILLRENWMLLCQSMDTLNMSVEKALTIDKKAHYSFEEMETFDSLTSKFNRSSDIYSQKVLRTIQELLHEPFVPFIDMLNKAEKMEVLQSADAMITIRDLRNQVAHEYIPEAIQELVPEVIALSKKLEENISLTKKFLEKRSWL